MTIPLRIPVRHEPGYHTDQIGRFRGGQFMGFVLAIVPPAEHRQLRPGWDSTGWDQLRRVYSILHLFDATGNHLRSNIWCPGAIGSAEPGEDLIELATLNLNRQIRSLPGHAFDHVLVKLFRVEFDGLEFGMIPRDEDGEYEGVTLEPNDLCSIRRGTGCTTPDSRFSVRSRKCVRYVLVHSQSFAFSRPPLR